MRILFLSPRQSWPPVSGAKLREYFLLRALGRSASVTHVYFSQPGPVLPSPPDFATFHRIVGIPPPKPYTVSRILRGLLGRWPLPVVNYTSQAMKVALAGVLEENSFDLLHVDSIQMAAYIPFIQRIRPVPVVYDWHNIESELMRRYGERQRGAARRLYASITARRLAGLESRMLRDGFGHLVCSGREQRQLLGIAPLARIAVIENGVDTTYFAEALTNFVERDRIVFVGSMNYHANIEAVTSFTSSVWPVINEHFPRWRLTIVGSRPAPAVLALRQVEGVEVTGTVADVRPYYKTAFAAVVPLHTGGGTRLKILEAMAAAVPVISTSLGAEGLAVTPGSDILIADNDEDWLPHLKSLSGDDGFRTRLVEKGRNLVQSRYDWETLGNRLYATYADWLAI